MAGEGACVVGTRRSARAPPPGRLLGSPRLLQTIERCHTRLAAVDDAAFARAVVGLVGSAGRRCAEMGLVPPCTGFSERLNSPCSCCKTCPCSGRRATSRVRAHCRRPTCAAPRSSELHFLPLSLAAAIDMSSLPDHHIVALTGLSGKIDLQNVRPVSRRRPPSPRNAD